MLDHLGQACREAREFGDLRQIDIATRANTTHATISRFETGEYWPRDPDRIVAAYAAELGVSSRSLWQLALQRWSETS